jgi:hypothetical protein
LKKMDFRSLTLCAFDCFFATDGHRLARLYSVFLQQGQATEAEEKERNRFGNGLKGQTCPYQEFRPCYLQGFTNT